MNASPAKAWIVQHRLDPEWKWYYEIAFGKRPTEELYDVKSDPDMIHNLVGKAEFELVKTKLAERLMTELKRAGDPRVVENPTRFEQSPFTDK